MNFLFVMNIGFDAPGPSLHLMETLIENLLNDGHTVYVIAKSTTGTERAIPQSLKQYTSIRIDTIRSSIGDRGNLAKRYWIDIKYMLSCVRFFRRYRNVDVVFLQSCTTAPFFITALRLITRKPLVYNAQDIWPVNALVRGFLRDASLSYRVLSYLQRCAYAAVTHIITISGDMKKTLIEEGVPSDKITVVHNWSYSDECYAIPDSGNLFLQKYQIDSDKFRVVYAGNIGHMQNIDVIIEAATQLRKEDRIHFYIIGDGTKREVYVRKVEQAGLTNVSFYPMQPPELAPHVYSMADVNLITLHPQVVKTALPSKTAVCLACGKPIIACVDPDSEFASLVESCSGCLVVHPSDAIGLSQAILRMSRQEAVNNPADLHSCFLAHFSKSRNSARYVDIIKRAASGDFGKAMIRR